MKPPSKKNQKDTSPRANEPEPMCSDNVLIANSSMAFAEICHDDEDIADYDANWC
jgi:hypothetical protein